jgi:hypothetical protein
MIPIPASGFSRQKLIPFRKDDELTEASEVSFAALLVFETSLNHKFNSSFVCLSAKPKYCGSNSARQAYSTPIPP